MTPISMSYIEQQIQYWRMMTERCPHPFAAMNLRMFERMKSQSLDGPTVEERPRSEEE